MSGFAVFPLLRAPESWPTWAVGAGAMVVLAALDIVGALAAKEWAASSRVGALLLGAAAFLVLFWVYASALQYAELALVTMGWIVVLQVALLLIDRFQYGVQLAPGKWVAVTVILLAQGYLVLGPAAAGAEV
ncbi:MAG: hypothetical protein ABJA89_08085 [Lapillicoccus sp.]